MMVFKKTEVMIIILLVSVSFVSASILNPGHSAARVGGSNPDLRTFGFDMFQSSDPGLNGSQYTNYTFLSDLFINKSLYVDTDTLFVDAVRNMIGIGTLSMPTWSTDSDVIYIHGRSSLAEIVNDLHVTDNAYFDGTNWRYVDGAPATNYYQAAGEHIWRTAISGTAGSVISWIDALTIDGDGSLTINNDLVVEGDTFLEGDANITNNLNVGGDTTIDGDTYIGGDTVIQGDTNITNNLNVGGGAIINNTLVVNNNFTSYGSAFFNQTVYFYELVEFNNTVVIAGNITIINGTISGGNAPATFVGKTTAKYDGNLDMAGGYMSANEICAAEYASAHVCQQFEIINTIILEDISAISGWSESAWVNVGGPKYAPATTPANDCEGWTNNVKLEAIGNFWIFDQTDGGYGAAINCDNELKFACCSSE